jgi:opacity protein-like surface antigen
MIKRLAVILAVAVSVASVAMAEEAPKAEVSLGYAYLHDDSFGDFDLSGSMPLGWMASANFNVNNWLGVVVDVSGNYKSEDTVLGEEVDFSVYGLHGGLRFSSYKNPAVTPYFQALAGVTRGSVSFVGFDESASDFSIQPGIGVIVRLSDSIGLDLGGDYRLIFSDEEKGNEFRAHAGIVFRIGR